MRVITITLAGIVCSGQDRNGHEAVGMEIQRSEKSNLYPENEAPAFFLSLLLLSLNPRTAFRRTDLLQERLQRTQRKQQHSRYEYDPIAVADLAGWVNATSPTVLDDLPLDVLKKATHIPSTDPIVLDELPPALLENDARVPSTSPIVLDELPPALLENASFPNPSSKPERMPKGALGPPSHFHGMEVGTQLLTADRECSLTRKRIDLNVKRVAARPAVFHVENLLSEAEVDQWIARGESVGMKPARTGDDGGTISERRVKCDMAALHCSTDVTVDAIRDALASLFLQPDLFESSEWWNVCVCDEAHIMKYSEGGEFRLHYDANDDVHRILTVLLYLNDVGETWFPLALQSRADAAELDGLNAPLSTALFSAEKLDPEKDGVRIAPRKGDAIAFYNHMDDGSFEVDALSVHAGLPAPDNKRIASLFFHLEPRSKVARVGSYQGTESQPELDKAVDKQRSSLEKLREGMATRRNKGTQSQTKVRRGKKSTKYTYKSRKKVR